MDQFVVKMDGEKVRVFMDRKVAKAWAKKHCRGKVEILPLIDCGRLPSASSRIRPNEDLKKLVYRPFISLA